MTAKLHLSGYVSDGRVWRETVAFGVGTAPDRVTLIRRPDGTLLRTERVTTRKTPPGHHRSHWPVPGGADCPHAGSNDTYNSPTSNKVNTV